MFLWLGSSKKTRRVKGGRKERAYCPECNEETVFYEVEIHEKVSVMVVLDVVDETERAFRCRECDSIGQLVDSDDVPASALEDLSPEAAARVERSRAAERLARAQAERERKQAERARMEARADDELAALKQQMGLTPEPDDASDPPPPDDDSSAGKKPWWKIW